MNQVTLSRKFLVLSAFALPGWAICGAVMFVGQAVTSLETTLILHAIAAPVVFAVLTWIYYRRFGYTSPLVTAVFFIAFVIILDFFLVALLINGSLEMFTSALGTWIPFALIVTASYLTGLLAQGRQPAPPTSLA